MDVFSTLMLLVWRQEGHLVHRNFCYKTVEV